jgi:hypothetical protein
VVTAWLNDFERKARSAGNSVPAQGPGERRSALA